MGSIKAFLLIFASALSVALAEPNCTTYGETDVVCTAGAEDYVLRRYLVSDNNHTTGITLRDCRITAIEQESFKNLDALEYLDLSYNKIEQVKLGVLDETLKVHYLNLAHNRISGFELGLLDQKPNLNLLDVSHNRIERLQLGVLDGTHNVTFMNLSYNLLSGFELGLFDQKPNLEVLDLKGNRISEIKLGVFDPLTKIRQVDLSSNMLIGRNMSPYLFDRSPGIRWMDFSRNDMRGTPDNMLHAFTEIDFLNLDRCSLETVPGFIKVSNLATMRHLIISTNAIEVITDTDFSNLVNLEILDLTANRIRSISDNAFKFSEKLKYVLIRYNELTSLPDTLFQTIPLLNNVDMSFNKLQVLPASMFKGTILTDLNISGNRFRHLEQNFCSVLRNTTGVTLSAFYFDQNPWQCQCLVELVNEVNQNEIQYKGSEDIGPMCVPEKKCTCETCNRQS